ncbi:MAG: hypothetical protein FWD73_08045 [Polyangiaceae bacterium]|nr:hypothetical protein [Polyangiaceae bacterium]
MPAVPSAHLVRGSLGWRICWMLFLTPTLRGFVTVLSIACRLLGHARTHHGCVADLATKSREGRALACVDDVVGVG